MVFTAIAGIFIVATVGGVGLGVASAESADELARAGAFGFDAATHKATALAAGEASHSSGAAPVYERSVLASTSTRTIDAGLQMIADREEAAIARERAKIEEYHRNAKAIDAAALERVRKHKRKQGLGGSDCFSGTDEYGLTAVDWSVGMEVFLNEWTARIDAYLAGTKLEGCGRIFAEAAWDNGVDPRWSPAISNTESGNGAHCFHPYNAWGWGEKSWKDWESAIKEHVKGLATVYGYSVTPQAAAVYCPPNTEWWYSNTLSQMGLI